MQYNFLAIGHGTFWCHILVFLLHCSVCGGLCNLWLWFLLTLICRYRSRRSRTPVSRSPRYRSRHYSRSRSPIRSRSPVRSRSRSPVEVARSRASPRVERGRSPSRSRSPSESRSSPDSKSPIRTGKARSRSSSSGSPDGKKGLVSYGDGSPDSSWKIIL